MDFSKLSLDEVKGWVYDKPGNINALRDFFGNKNTPPDLQAGQNLTRDTLGAYQELAQRIVDAGKDSTGVQANVSSKLLTIWKEDKMLLDRLAVEKELDVQEELEFAILDQDMARTQKLIRENPLFVNVGDENGHTPLYFAAREANTDAARILLNSKADVNTKDNWGKTPLFAAIYEEPLVFDRIPIVTLLIEEGANINAKDHAGDTPLHMAAFGETAVVKLLLERGADANAVNNAGETPLHKAVQYPEYEVVHELLVHGGLKGAHNRQGLTPVQIAEERGWANLVELFHSAQIEREAVR